MTSNGMTAEQAARLSMAEQHEWFKQATSRRTMLRGGLVGAAVVAGPALLAGTASAATASTATATATAPSASSLLQTAQRPAGSAVAPFARHINFGADPTSQVSVTWQVPAPVSRPFIRIGESPLDLGEKIPATLSVLTTPFADVSPVDSVPLIAPTTIEQYYIQARVEHLLPGHTYYYAVGHDGYDPAAHHALDPARPFTTAPNGKPEFTFTAFGDQGVTYDAVAVANLIRSQNPVLHLHAGDLSYANSSGDGLITDSYDPRIWDSFLVQNELFAASVPWQAVVGNHEMEPWYSPDGYGGFLDRFAQPVEGQTYYSFTYGNVAFLALDANDVNYEFSANIGYTGGAQTKWLGRQLAAYRADKGIDFIVVYFHQCAYCTAKQHASDGGVRAVWTPLFDQYDVDLVINGHNHVYERTDPLRAGSVTTAAPIGATVDSVKYGTTYVVAGSSGESLYQFTAADSYENDVDNLASVTSWVRNSAGGETPETVDWSRVRYTGYALLAVDSIPGGHGTKPQLVLRGVNEYGVEIDRLTIVRSA
jgi:Calcineurin-like phosphoesterase/Purple acid Phosphatase, N-terminal domain